MPPVSLVWQLLWRDVLYTTAFGTPNFDCMKNKNIYKQISWSNDEELLAAWQDARTGYPWIDAIMVQLLKWRWMHHLARHSVACFLTCGVLFVHREKGRDVFERLLIDSDWSINNGNWLCLPCSSFFYQKRVVVTITFQWASLNQRPVLITESYTKRNLPYLHCSPLVGQDQSEVSKERKSLLNSV